MDTLAIYGGPRQLHLRRTVRDGFESSPIWRRLGAFGNNCYRRSPRAKTPRTQIRHFDHELWQQKCDNIVLQGNLAKLSQNDEMRLGLIHTGQRRLAEARPHDKLWGISLSACDYRASSPSTWRGSNLLGQALEQVRETLHSKSMPQLSRF